MIVVEKLPNEEQEGASSEGQGDKIVLHVKFPLDSKGYFYQHDDFPDANSAVPRAMQWISIANVLHAPVKVPLSTEVEKSE